MHPTFRSAPTPTARAVRRRTILAALTLTTLAGCDDATGPAAGSEPTFTGRWAGRPWRAGGAATLVRGGAAGDTLHVGASWPWGGDLPRQSLRMRLAPFHGPGTYTLAGDAVQMEDLLGGDAVTSAYVGARPTAGVVVVTAYAEGGVVEGTVSFRAVPAYGGMPYGSAPSFEDGRFRARVHVFVRGER